MPVKIDTQYLTGFIDSNELDTMAPLVKTAHGNLHSKANLADEPVGWLYLPQNYDRNEFARIKKTAEKIQENSDIFIVVGIGGSYLGSRAAIEFLKSRNYNYLNSGTPDIFFAGNDINPGSLTELMKICDGKDVSINVISKSGTTIEPAIAFRVLKKMLEKKYGKEGAKDRIFCTTDREKGALKELAKKEGYETFVVPDDIGGRYSVLTAVGLLPMAVCGVDINQLMSGAVLAQSKLMDADLNENDCYRYAAIRNILYKKRKEIEILESYNPNFFMFSEWFKQLFGESEGKDNKGIFPSSLIFSTDLHSMGQLIQDGKRNLFETVLTVSETLSDLVIDEELDNADGLNFLSGKTIHYVNKQAEKATILAHTEGGVPNIILSIPTVCEFELGYLFYFFEKACAISGYLLGVNPFNQPGVERYKRNMMVLLNHPKYR